MATLLTRPPASWGTDGVLQPGDLGADFDIFWSEVAGRGPANRQLRVALRGVAYHIMGANARTPQAFLDSMAPSGATLSECSFFDASTSPTGRACMLQVLPVQRIGAGTVAGCASYITAETSPAVGQDADNYPWTEAQIELLARFYAFLVKNPRGWSRVSVPYQLSSDPYSSTAGSGGFGFHTFYGDVSNTVQGGTSPWTLSVRTCPGYTRRGYRPTTPHYELKLSDNLPGNVRALFNRIGTKVAPSDPITGDDMVLIKGNSIVTPPGGGAFPYTGNGDATWLPVAHPTKGYCLAHVDSGTFRDVMNAAGELRVCDQNAVDKAPKMTAQEYRDFLAACSAKASPVDLSLVAKSAELVPLAHTTDVVSSETDILAAIAAIPPGNGGGGGGPLAVELTGTLNLHDETLTLTGTASPESG